MLRLSLFSLVRRAPSRLVAAPKARFSSWTSPQQSWWSRHPILSTLGGVTLGSALYVGYQYQQRVLVYPSAVRAHLRRGLFACQKGDFLSAQEPFAKAYAEARASPSLTQDGQAMLGLVARYIDVLEAVNDTDTAIRVLQDTFSTLLHPPFSSSSSPIPPKTLSTPKITIDLAVRLADLLEDTGDTEGCARALLWSLFHMLSKAPQAMQPPSFGSIPDMRKAMADWSSVEDVAAVMERLARLYFVQGRIDASLGLYRRLLPLLPESQVCERSTILIAISGLTLQKGDPHAARVLLRQLNPTLLKHQCSDVWESMAHTSEVINQAEQGESSSHETRDLMK